VNDAEEEEAKSDKLEVYRKRKLKGTAKICRAGFSIPLRGHKFSKKIVDKFPPLLPTHGTGKFIVQRNQSRLTELLKGILLSRLAFRA
jgi:hypothetical protein